MLKSFPSRRTYTKSKSHAEKCALGWVELLADGQVHPRFPHDVGDILQITPGPLWGATTTFDSHSNPEPNTSATALSKWTHHELRVCWA